MVKLTKKQISGIIKMLDKQEHRPGLMYLTFVQVGSQETLALSATNGYVMALVTTSTPVEDEIKGKGIQVDALKRWYATASNRDFLTEDDLKEMAAELSQSYPDINRAIPQVKGPVESIALNPDYYKILNTIAETELVFTTYGHGKALIADTETGRYVLMPILAK